MIFCICPLGIWYLPAWYLVFVIWYLVFVFLVFGICQFWIWDLSSGYLVFVYFVSGSCLYGNWYLSIESGFQRWTQLVLNAVIWRPSMTAASMFGSVRSFWRGRMMRICASPSSFFTGRCLNTTQAQSCETHGTNLEMNIHKTSSQASKLR